MRRGFTLLELCFVVTLIAALTAISVPVFSVLVARSHAAEARTMVHAIAHAELQHYRDHGAFLACPAAGEIPGPVAAFPDDEPCWEALGVRVGQDVRYRYSVSLEGESYQVLAEGDQDGDGERARFVLDGRELALTVTGELE